MNFADNAYKYQQFLKELEKEGLTEDPRNSKGTYWGNIPIDYRHLRELYNIYELNMKFVDLGCGAGNVLRFAQNIGYDVKGVEFNKDLFRYLKEFDCIYSNIEELPQEFYSNFDVIYSYLPIKVDKEQYINKLIGSMRQGAFLVLPHYQGKDPRLEYIFSSYYQIK